MILPMKQVSIMARKNELKTVIDTLKESVSFEMTLLSKFETPPENVVDVEYRDYLMSMFARVRSAIEFIKKNSDKNKVWTKVSELEYGDLQNVSEDIMLDLLERMEKISGRQTEIDSAIEKNNDSIAEFRPYENLPMKFSLLQNTKNIFVLCGIIPTGNFVRFRKKTKLDDIFIEKFDAGAGKSCVVIVGHRDNYEAIADILNYRFERCHFDSDKTAAEVIYDLEMQNMRLSSERDYNTLIGQYSVTDTKIQSLKTYHDYLANELNTYDIIGRTASTAKYYVAHGWIVATDETRIVDAVYMECPDAIVNVADPGIDDKPPVVMVNKRFIQPYQEITTMYGAPSPGDIDPNPFLAVFYFLFFGFMIGDAGYGFILSLGILTYMQIKKPHGSTKNMMRLFCMGGISAIFWGFVFSSFFGYSFYPALFDPLHRSVEFMIFAFSLGFLHIIFGIGLNAYNAWRKGKIIDAFLDSIVRIVMLLGIVVLILGITVLQDLMIPGVVLLGLSLATILFTNGRKKKGFFGKVTGSFGGIYSLVGYFSDIVSYARLFGLALVGAVVAMVGNTMGEMLFAIPFIGIPIGILVALLFHAFNLALGLLSAYVHGARLQFVEFFSKFYLGEGKVFKPTSANLKYTRLKSSMLQSEA